MPHIRVTADSSDKTHEDIFGMQTCIDNPEIRDIPWAARQSGFKEGKAQAIPVSKPRASCMKPKSGYRSSWLQSNRTRAQLSGNRGDSSSGRWYVRFHFADGEGGRVGNWGSAAGRLVILLNVKSAVHKLLWDVGDAKPSRDRPFVALISRAAGSLWLHMLDLI